jgi:hypothetical protein
LPITVATATIAVIVAVAVASCQSSVAQTLRLENKLDGATNFKGMHLYINYIIRVFVGDVQLAKGPLSKQ